MADSAKEADLSVDLPDDDTTKMDYRLALDKQRLRHRSVAFYVLLVCGIILIASFLNFERHVVDALSDSNKTAVFSWPLFALGSVTLLSGVTLLFGIARFTYRQEGIGDGEADTFPPAEAIGKVVELVRMATGKGQD